MPMIELSFAVIDRPEGFAEGWVCVAMTEPIKQRMVAVVALRTLARNEAAFRTRQKRQSPALRGFEYGAGTKSRTRDLLITSQLLYQLSYTGICGAHYIHSFA